MPLAGDDTTGKSTASGMQQSIVLLNQGGQPVLLEEGEVRALDEEQGTNSGELRTKRQMRGGGEEGMALAMVNGGPTKMPAPVFRALTATEALRTAAPDAAYPASDTSPRSS